jgi:glucose/arabinose dehydrogenase
VEVIVSNLEIPWSMAFAADGRLFMTERPGRVRIVDITRRSTTLALTLDDVFAQGEAGLLGLALDPAFAQNHFVYVFYTARRPLGGAVNRVVRYREVGGTLGEFIVLLDNLPANTLHDGGRLRFGPDGLLYITTGDAGNQQFAQDLGSLAGKILRIRPDGTTPANPFASPIYSYGHRNPQGIDWNPSTGDLWESEHGNVANDEVNVIDAGLNYGWPLIEGAQSRAGLQPPVTFYDPTTIAPSGASFYRGKRFDQFDGNFFIATLRGAHLLRLRTDSRMPRLVAAQERLLDQQFGRIRDVIEGPDGYLYFCTNNRDGRGNPLANDDRIARLVPAS